MNISSVVPSIDTATETMTDFEKVDRVCRRRSADTYLFLLPSGAYTRSFWIGIFHIKNFYFWVPFLKQLLLRNCAVEFVEICNVYIGKMIIKAAKIIFNSDKIRRSYSDLNYGVTFLENSVVTRTLIYQSVESWMSLNRRFSASLLFTS